MGWSSSSVKSSTEQPASPVSAARVTVRATPPGSPAKQFSRSAETGSSVAATIAAACARASSRLTEPSRRPSVAANPELVVASAWNPREASSFADPWSHGFGSSNGFPGRCRSRNCPAFSVWVVITCKLPNRDTRRRRERQVILVPDGRQLRDEHSAGLMVRLVDSLYGRVWQRSVSPRLSIFTFIAKERIAMTFLDSTRLRGRRVSRWLAGATALSLCALAGAYWAPQTASAAGPSGGSVAHSIPRGATVLPDGRYVRPAGIQYNLGDFSLGLAMAPNGRCAASSDEGWGNGRVVPAVPKVNRAGTEPDEGVTAVNLVTGATQFVTVNRKPAQNFMGIGLAYSHDGTRLYATSGGTDAVYQFNVAADCRLTYVAAVDLPSQAPPASTSR